MWFLAAIRLFLACSELLPSAGLSILFLWNCSGWILSCFSPTVHFCLVLDLYLVVMKFFTCLVGVSVLMHLSFDFNFLNKIQDFRFTHLLWMEKVPFVFSTALSSMILGEVGGSILPHFSPSIYY